MAFYTSFLVTSDLKIGGSSLREAYLRAKFRLPGASAIQLAPETGLTNGLEVWGPVESASCICPILPSLPGSAPYRFRGIKRKDDPPIAEQLVTYTANERQFKSARTYYVETTSLYNILQGRASLGALPV